MSGKAPINPRRIVTKTNLRLKVIAIGSGVAILGLLVWGMLAMKSEQGKPSTNMVTGPIVSKISRGERENEISVGKKGFKSRETDTGYAFMVRNPANGKEYEVPTNEAEYEAKKVGDMKTFIRPPSEQE